MPYSNPYNTTVEPPIKMSISVSNSSSTTSSPTRPRRSSRFIEGTEVTRPEILQRTPTSNELLFNILSEMDAHEAQRNRNGHSHRGSNSSLESFESPGALPGSKPTMPAPKEGRRSINFGRMSLDGRPSREQLGYAHGESDAERLAKKVKGQVKGRLRAWTVGKDKPMPYPGT